MVITIAIHSRTRHFEAIGTEHKTKQPIISITTTVMKSSFRMRPSIILFGDSITEQGFGCFGTGFPDTTFGWASLLAADYSRRADVLSRGFSGYTSRHAVEHLLPKEFPPHDGDNGGSCLFATVFFGANDSALPGELQHVPMEEYGQNLVTIVKHIRKSHPQPFPIFLLTPPPFDAAAWMSFRRLDSPGRDNQVARAYGNKVKEVAANLDQCAVVDTWNLLEGSSDNKSQYLSDGLHLNEAGNRLVHKAIMEVLKKDFPHIAPMVDGDGKYGTNGIPLEEPLWRELF